MQAVARKSLLFVDDEQRILRSLKALFRRDYDVYVANSGKEAIDFLNGRRVDVVVSDQRMPEMLGHELLSQVRQMQPHAIRMLLTGYMDKSAIIDTINDGEIYRFISKPWNINEIKELVAEAALAADADYIDEVIPMRQKDASVKEQLTRLKGNIPAVLIMGSNQETRNQIRATGKENDFKIYSSSTIREAVETLNLRANIGVAILSIDHHTQEEVVNALAMMRGARPDLCSIVLADMMDSQTAVDLINHSKVFRYLPQPMDDHSLEKTLVDGMLRHNKLKNNVAARKRYSTNTNKLKISGTLKKIFSIFDISSTRNVM